LAKGYTATHTVLVCYSYACAYCLKLHQQSPDGYPDPCQTIMPYNLVYRLISRIFRFYSIREQFLPRDAMQARSLLSRHTSTTLQTSIARFVSDNKPAPRGLSAIAELLVLIIRR